MRLFFAAMLPEPVQTGMGKLREKLDWIPTKTAWSAACNLHITLKFLGEVPDAQVNDVATSARCAIPATGALTLQPAHPVFFPPRGDARVLGVGFTGDTQKLIEVQSAIESACEGMGFPREHRTYTPHATLARFRDGLRPVHRPRIEEACAAIKDIREFSLAAVQLMQSKLSPRGSEYAVVATFPISS